MKRSPLGPGKKSLARRTTFSAPRKPLGRRRRRRAEVDRDAAAAWAAAVKSRPCVICADPVVDAHHVIYQQLLKRLARSRAIQPDHLLWDLRNGLPVCRHHHAAHHAARDSIPLSVVLENVPGVLHLARELDLTWWLEHQYP